jgi:hypothetical protein
LRARTDGVRYGAHQASTWTQPALHQSAVQKSQILVKKSCRPKRNNGA